MMGRHETADTFDAVVSDYVTGRARHLIAQFDGTLEERALVDWDGWIGAAAEILRELTRGDPPATPGIPCCAHCIHAPGFVHQMPCLRPWEHKGISDGI